MQPLFSCNTGLALDRGTLTSCRQPGLRSFVQGRGPAGQPGVVTEEMNGWLRVSVWPLLFVFLSFSWDPVYRL